MAPLPGPSASGKTTTALASLVWKKSSNRTSGWCSRNSRNARRSPLSGSPWKQNQSSKTTTVPAGGSGRDEFSKTGKVDSYRSQST